MVTRLALLATIGALVLIAESAASAESPHKASPFSDAQPLTEKIDQHLARRWASGTVEARADDAEFLRRVYLDLAGRIPSVEDARTFLEDSRSDKRTRLIEKLLAGPRYVAHFTNVWRATLLPEAGNNFQVRLQQGSFENWLKKQLTRNAGYDQMVRDLLTASLGGGGPFGLAAIYGDSGPLTYYLAKEFKPENLAASTARVFLGVSVECAQCHNHPVADWKREQFWGFAAFFAGIKSQRQMDFLLPAGDDAKKHELAIPGTEKVVQAKFLDGVEPAWKSVAGARGALAGWLTAKQNEYFARAAVNRIWAYFFGIGLVEPVDDMVGPTSTASHPELLDLLAREFAGHGFDLKFLMRAITMTRAYQLTSASTHPGQDDPTLFARMALRGLTAEQLFDSLAQATGYRDAGGGGDLISGLVGGARSARAEILTKFARTERPIDAEMSILQSLSLMNGKVIGAATSLEQSETLAAIADAPFLTTAQRVETLYLAALSRQPHPKELERAVQFVHSGANIGQGKEESLGRVAKNNGLADLFWALLNSPEFVVNH